jgi:hypothetical protein
MTVSRLLRKWNSFFFDVASPTPVALYRVFYGILNILNVWLMSPDWLVYFGPHSIVMRDTMRDLTLGPRINLLGHLPVTPLILNVYFWVFVVVAVFVTIGFMTRLSVLVLYLLMMSLQMRNVYILNGGDTLLRVCGFFLIFAPAGAAFSVDRLLRIWRGTEGVAIAESSPWAQRLIQIQVSVVYVTTFWWKTMGKTWMDGTAVYYSLHLREIARFPLPGMHSPWFMKLATWGTLIVEFSAGVLIWLRDLRYYVLLAIVGLHLGIEYSMNLPLFEWIAMAPLITFVDPADLSRAWAWVRQRVGPRIGSIRIVVYDPALAMSVRAANVLRVIDIFGRLRVVEITAPETLALLPVPAPVVSVEHPVMVITPAGPRAGFALLTALAPVIPLLWPLAPLALGSHSTPRVPGAASAVR